MSAADVTVGPDFEEVLGDDIGFQDVALKGTSLRASQPWPEDQLPPITASLLSIASRKGLMAVAGPEGLHITGTEKTRRAYIPRPDGDEKVRPLQPDATLSVPRVSQVAFNSDEGCLIVAAEQGGGLAVYDTDELHNSPQPAFQIATNGTSVRAILPNPSLEASHLIAVLLTNGQLLLADLKSRGLVNTPNGSPVLHENVSAASWSRLGKQIVAGRSDSTAVQLDTQGIVKAEIARPPQLQQVVQEKGYDNVEALPISSITWLSTYEFFIAYTPSYSQHDDMNQQDSLYFVAARAGKGQPLVFRRFSLDLCGAFGMIRRTPAHQFVARLNDWDKAADILVIASTASTDVNMIGKFKEGAQGFPSDQFVVCTPSLETRQAQLPISEISGSDVSPLGLAIDLSTKEVAPRPVPSNETIQHSGRPLPAMYVLNTDGILNIWWIVYNEAVRNQTFAPGIVHRAGRYAKYQKFTRETQNMPQDVDGRYQDRPGEVEFDETEPLAVEGSAPESTSTAMASFTTQPASTQQTVSASPATSGASTFLQPASSQQKAVSPQAAFGSSNALGQKASPWAAQPGSTPAKPSFGQASLGQTSFGSSTSAARSNGTPAKPTFGQASFGQTSTPGATPAWGKPSTPSQTPTFGQPSGPTSTLGQTSTMGGGSLFGQPSKPATGSGFGQVGQMGVNKSLATAGASKPSSTSGFSQYATSKNNGQQGSTSLFASVNNPASPLAAAGQNTPSPFAAFAQKKPELSKEASMGSTATIGSGSSPFSSFGQPSGMGSSFASKPAVSRESTMGGGDQSKAEQPKQQGSGLFGLGSGFKLGSGFQGDGSARDDLPKPKTGDSLFGTGFGAALGATNNEKLIKAEPGTERQFSLQDIPAAKQQTSMAEDAPLPPDPSSYKAKMPDDAPLPPDPTTYKAPKLPDDLPPMPGVPSTKKEGNDIPIAGSPPVDVTNSQTFSPVEGSEEDGPPEDDDDDDLQSEEDEEQEHDSQDGEESDQDDNGSWQDDDEEEEEEEEEGEEEDEGKPYVVQDPKGLADLKARMTNLPTSPNRPPKQESRTPQSDEKTEKSSYTPAGLPKGPVFEPPKARTQQSPRSPSPQRAVTSPVRGRGIPQTSLPSQIKASAVPPAKPVQRPAAPPPKPREPTAGELEDQAIARVEALLAAPIKPEKEFPPFYTHTNYTGAVDNTGIGGQIERVFRDVNSMIHTLGLNARSLTSFLQGQEVLRRPGERTIDDLDDTDVWCLGDLNDLSNLLLNIEKQLHQGKLEHVQEKLKELGDEQKEVLRLKAKTVEMRKQIHSHTDPLQQAMRDAAPLSAETQAQQFELRQGVQNVQKLLSEVEQKMSMLRADMASLSSSGGQKNGMPVPTVENVTNTIHKMIAQVQQQSADIDFLESQIKGLPQGIASLRLSDDYEDDLASRLAGNRLLTDRNSPRATPPRRPRMAANGDPLGMSGMFGVSRFQTPPSNRRSMRFTPDASGLGRSTGSLGASTRKKMSEVTTEEVEMYESKAQRRAKVLATLKGKVERQGARIVKPG